MAAVAQSTLTFLFRPFASVTIVVAVPPDAPPLSWREIVGAISLLGLLSTGVYQVVKVTDWSFLTAALLVVTVGLDLRARHAAKLASARSANGRRKSPRCGGPCEDVVCKMA